MAMKKQLIPCALLSACLMLGAGTAAMADTPAAGPKLVAHYKFEEGAVGKDSAGTDDLSVFGKDGVTAAEATVVEGPDGMSALEFNRTYALKADADDVIDDLKEFTITYLVAANDDNVMKFDMFSTGLTNINSVAHTGINALMSKGTGFPEIRLFGSESQTTHTDPTKWGVNQFKNDDNKIGTSNWAQRDNPYTYTANDWYRVVITVKLSDGTKGEEITNANNETYFAGTGMQSCYIDKMGAVSDKSKLVENKNYYEYTLPYDLTSIASEEYGLTIGACYKPSSQAFFDDAEKNFSMFVGKMADFRIYDKALTQDQIVELYKNNQLATDVEDDTSNTSTESNTSNTSTVSNTSTTSTTSTTSNASEAPTSTASAPPTGVAGNMLPLLVLIPAAGVAGVLVVRRKGKASK